MSETNAKVSYEELDNHELLVKLAKQGRHRMTLLIVLIVLVLIAALILLFAIFSLIPKVTEAMDVISRTAEECSVSLQKIDAIDIDSLNTAISDFAKVAKTIAALFGK